MISTTAQPIRGVELALIKAVLEEEHARTLVDRWTEDEPRFDFTGVHETSAWANIKHLLGEQIERFLGGPGSGRYPKGSGKQGEPSLSSARALASAMLEHVGIKASTSLSDISPMERGRVKEGIIKQYSDQAMAAAQLTLWAQTSGDSKPEAVGMQNAVAKEFGLKEAATEHMMGEADIMGYGWKDNDTPDQLPTGRVVGRGSSTMDEGRAYSRAEYNNTQAFLKTAGISEVTLYRGTGKLRDDDGNTLKEGSQTINSQPASSWTTDLNTAVAFAKSQSPNYDVVHVLTTSVPASRILSTAVTGRGALSEAEVLVLGGKTKVSVFTTAEEHFSKDGAAFIARIKATLKP